MKARFTLAIVAVFSLAHGAQAADKWRQATETELRQLIPARAPVEKEQIETEFRTASGINNGKGQFIAGVVLITAGYAAEGKYSNFFIVQSAIKVGSISLKRGEYVFGFRRKDEDTLTVKFYDAHSGRELGDTEAHRLSRTGRLESFRISPPGERSTIEIGRFGMKFTAGE